MEEDVDLKKQYRTKNLPAPIILQETATKNYIDNVFKNDTDRNDVELEIINFVKVDYQAAFNQHLSPKIYVDNIIDQPTLVKKNSGK